MLDCAAMSMGVHRRCCHGCCQKGMHGRRRLRPGSDRGAPPDVLVGVLQVTAAATARRIQGLEATLLLGGLPNGLHQAVSGWRRIRVTAGDLVACRT
jgi:hypothetical protein